VSIFLDTSSQIERRHPMRVAVVGCTGSIGTQTLDVCRRHPDKLRVTGLAAYDSVEQLVRYAREFEVRHVAVGNEARKHDPIFAELPDDCELTFGMQAVAELAAHGSHDCVMNAVVGALGITVGHAALVADKILLYANKESIVVGGDLLMPLAKPGKLIPVDSEHNAIYQCLIGERMEEVHRIWLTCSGGPFYGMTRDELKAVTAADALAHPNWAMGPKISIDCATLMNKGLEVIEAQHLFEVPIDQISVLVQRQSRIHSMVEFTDGSVKAQMGASDMRIPIQCALSFPERWESPCEHRDYCQEPAITFGEADEEVFGCLALAKDAGRTGGTLPCAMNAANEVANEWFRAGGCGFLDIERVVSEVMDETNVERVETIQHLNDVDEWARERARVHLRALGR